VTFAIWAAISHATETEKDVRVCTGKPWWFLEKREGSRRAGKISLRMKM